MQKEYDDKFRIQDNQYEFPYHFIPYIKGDVPVLFRYLAWGYEYVAYMIHCRNILLELKPDSLLDVGCGEGRFLSLVANDIPMLKGVDLSERAILFAKGFSPNISFDCINAAELNESYDVVTAIEVLEHIPDTLISVFFKHPM